VKRILTLLLMVALGAVPSVVRADELCRGHGWPMTPEFEPSPRIVTFDNVYGEKVNVLLPDDYNVTTKRYPVLYVMHGGTWGAKEGPDVYLAYTDLIDRSAGQDVIVVMPYTGRYGVGMDWRDGSQAWETFIVDQLIPWVDDHFRSVNGRAGRALAGESMGGFVAMSLAARHPDLFVAAGSFSGWLDLTIGDAGWFAAFTAIGIECGGDGRGAFSDPVTAGMDLRDHNPPDLAGNLGASSVYFDTGNGVPCTAEDVTRPSRPGPAALFPLAIGLEAMGRPMNQRFHDAARAAGIAHTASMRQCGTHDFPYFNHALDSFWPHMMSAFSRPPATPPAVPFDLARAAATFRAWDWTFAADPARAAEFLSVADASCRGLGLTGSGLTTITTARCFRPRSIVLVDGERTRADGEGRITFTVDLGPAHQHEQFTPAARALEAAGGYWTSTTVTLKGGGS